MSQNQGGGFGGLSWESIAQWLGGAGLGGAALAGAKLAIDKLFPSGSERLADRAKRRVEQADRITALEQELDDMRRELEASHYRALAEKEAHLLTKAQLISAQTEHELLRRRLEGPVVTLPRGTTAVVANRENAPILRDGEPVNGGALAADTHEQERDGTDG